MSIILLINNIVTFLITVVDIFIYLLQTFLIFVILFTIKII